MNLPISTKYWNDMTLCLILWKMKDQFVGQIKYWIINMSQASTLRLFISSADEALHSTEATTEQAIIQYFSSCVYWCYYL